MIDKEEARKKTIEQFQKSNWILGFAYTMCEMAPDELVDYDEYVEEVCKRLQMKDCFAKAYELLKKEMKKLLNGCVRKEEER